MTSKIVVNNIEADAGVSTVTFNSNVERGSSNLHSTGLNVNDTFVHSTGIALGAGSTIGAVTGVTTYYGDGSQLTGISAGTSLSGSTNDTICTVTGANAIQGEANLTFSGSVLNINGTTDDTPLMIDTTSNNGAHLRFRKDGSNQHFVGAGGGFSLGDKEDLSLRGYDNILFATGNTSTERMRISSQGYVTKPATPCFDAVKSNGNVSAGNIIQYNTVNVNNGNHYNSSNGRFTAPVAGFYFFSYGTIKNNTNNVTRLHIYKNGSRIYNAGRHLRMDSGQSYGDNGAMTIVVSLAVSDYISIKVEEGEVYGATQEYCYFNGFLIG